MFSFVLLCHELSRSNITFLCRWVVDLGSVQTVASVTIYQRTDVSGGMLAGFRIYVGTRNTTWDDTSNVICPNPYTDVQGASATVSCGLAGRFVWVMVPGSSRQLALCQVQVWGRIPWIWRQLSGTAEVTCIHKHCPLLMCAYSSCAGRAR
jgi:hypothetical protein